MKSTHISNVCGRGPSFFVLGPLDSVQSKDPTKRKNMFTIHTAEGNMDMSSKWASIGVMKLKDSHTEIEKTTCTWVFVGSETSRRSQGKHFERQVAQDKRWGGGKGGGFKPRGAKWTQDKWRW